MTDMMNCVCGSDDITPYNGAPCSYAYVRCTGCGRAQFGDTLAEVTAAWNTRHPTPAADEVEAVVKLKPQYPDYGSDADGLVRFREDVRTHRGHDMAVLNHNSLGRLIDTIDRFRFERDSAIAALQARSAEPASDPCKLPAEHPDDVAVERFAAAMKEKLARKRGEGRGGWQNRDECSAERLSSMLRDHVGKGDPVDVANFAMMLHQRGDRITSAQPAGEEPVACRREIPDDIAAMVHQIGRAQWGQTEAFEAEGHAAHIAESVRLTDENFGQTGPRHMHGLYIEDTDTVICHTGTSPNSPQIARALTGAWNWLHDQATKPATPTNPERRFALGQRVTKTKGSKWTGRVVGFYSTALTAIGYAVESETETGSVQIYPEAALSVAPLKEGE